MISEIEVRAKSNLSCPEYVTKLDKLDKGLFTWRKDLHSPSSDRETGIRVICLLFVYLFVCFFVCLLDFLFVIYIYLLLSYLLVDLFIVYH
jgi:hypothetical protein